MLQRRFRALALPILCTALLARPVSAAPPQSRGVAAPPAAERAEHADPLGENAALCYWIAFTQLPTLDAAQEKIVEEGPTTPLNADARKVIQLSETSLRYMHYGSRLSRCDWGSPREEGFALLLPHLGKGRQVARLALLRARDRFESGDQQGAVDDVADALALGRHLGSGGILISELVRNAVEQTAVEAAAPHLAGLSPAALDRLADRLDRLPAGPTLRDSIRVEQQIGQAWLIARLRASARSGDWRQVMTSAFDQPAEGGAPKNQPEVLIQASGGTVEGVIAQLEKLNVFFDEVGPLLELPPDQFRARYAELGAKIKDNPFAKPILPAHEQIYDKNARYRARLAMFRAAVAVARAGAAGADKVKDFRDPFGDGPFEYRARPDGFELRSKLTLRPKPDQQPEPLTLVVGGGKKG